MSELKNIIIKEISLVDVPANDKKFLLFKRKEGVNNMENVKKENEEKQENELSELNILAGKIDKLIALITDLSEKIVPIKEAEAKEENKKEENELKKRLELLEKEIYKSNKLENDNLKKNAESLFGNIL